MESSDCGETAIGAIVLTEITRNFLTMGALSS